MNNIQHQIDQLHSEWTKAKISGEIGDLLGRRHELAGSRSWFLSTSSISSIR